MDWTKLLMEIFITHKGKVIGVLLGLVFGLFTIIFSFWKAIFISICIIIGFYLGKRVDENEEFKSLIRKFLNNS
jgi:uncharacterized membrane protein